MEVSSDDRRALCGCGREQAMAVARSWQLHCACGQLDLVQLDLRGRRSFQRVPDTRARGARRRTLLAIWLVRAADLVSLGDQPCRIADHEDGGKDQDDAPHGEIGYQRPEVVAMPICHHPWVPELPQVLPLQHFDP